jgi:hypothetical protein
MRFRSLLLRVLLCLALLANGTTAVFASARMALDADMAMAMQHDAASPCHDEANDEAPKQHPASHDDCCGTGACLCSCVAHVPAFLAVDALLLTPPRAAPPVSAPHVSRANPALQHPIRPPIG